MEVGAAGLFYLLTAPFQLLLLEAGMVQQETEKLLKQEEVGIIQVSAPSRSQQNGLPGPHATYGLHVGPPRYTGK